jgi:hypothetical protein
LAQDGHRPEIHLKFYQRNFPFFPENKWFTDLPRGRFFGMAVALHYNVNPSKLSIN